MCGDLEEEDRLGAALYERFRGHARVLLKGHADGRASARDTVASYMDGLFGDALARSLRDGDRADEERRSEILAAQAVVFARLAGLLAGHAAPPEDPLRKAIEALIHGYAEAGEIPADPGHDHDEDHGDHHHGHGNPHRH